MVRGNIPEGTQYRGSCFSRAYRGEGDRGAGDQEDKLGKEQLASVQRGEENK